MQPDLTSFLANGSVVLDSRRTRPLWFDGRFLAARDLEREQNYFLQREADLGQAPGFGVLHGLMVDQKSSTGQTASAGTIVIHAGDGITPAGEMVRVTSDLAIQLSALTESQALDAQLGLSIAPPQSPQKRTGLYVIALQPLEYTANPITAYPTTVQGKRSTHPGDIVEATVVTLWPYPNPPSQYGAALQQAALARQIFVTGSAAALPDSLLPLAVVSLQQGAISWIDPYLVRRETGPQYTGVNFGLTDPATQLAYMLQYDTQLQAAVAARLASGLKANFAAGDYFQALPPAGRFPIDAIDTSAFSQVFFPQEMDVRLSIIPSDELPALLQDGLSLPPIDLTLPDSSYESLAVFAFIPVPVDSFAALKSSLPDTPLNPTLPQVLANRSPIQLLQLYQGAAIIAPPLPVADSAWAKVVSGQKYGYYLRRRSDPAFVPFTTPSGILLVSSQNPSAFGQSVTFTAMISPGSATGSVQFFDGAAALGTVAVSGGAAAMPLSTLAVGDHPITAVYGGDATNAGSTSAVLTQTVTKTASITTLSSSANPSTIGQAVTFTANVSPGSATGSVKFLDGSTLLGTVTLNSGVAALPAISSLALGAHPITAVYNGDSNLAASTSAVLTQTVAKVISTTSVSSSSNPSKLGQPVTFTANVSPGAATGSVQFLDGATVLGSAPLTGGVATLPALSSLTVGNHAITAVYSGDGNTAASTSPALLQTVSKTISSVALSSSANSSTFGQTVTFTANVSPASATGSVQFLDGTSSLGTAILSGGAATLAAPSLAVGSHSITAVYSGDANDAASTSAVLTQVVNKVASGVTLSSSVNPSAFGQSVTFTAKVTPTSATGSMQFLDGTTVLGTGTVSGGVAVLPTAALGVGSHSITAVYGGDANDAASTSAVLTQTVSKSASTVTLTTSVNPSAFGQSVSFTARLSPSSATGTVEFLDGTTALGTVTMSGGAATLAVSTLSVGAHSITAAYDGDGNNAASISPILIQTVDKTASSVALNSSVNPSTFGQAVVFTAAATPPSASGNVQFLDGATALGTGLLTSGTASLSVSSLSVGARSITAGYGGDGNDEASTSPVLTQNVSKAGAGVTLSSSANPSTLGQSVTFTAKLSPATATGSVQFLEGAAVLGTSTVSGGAATFAVSSLAVGTHSVTAAYSGDANNSASTSAVLTQTVNKAPAGVTVSSSANPSTFGQTVTFTANLTPASATGSIQFLDGATVLGAGTVSGGITTLAASLAVGAHSITAVYSGDGNNAAATSPVLTQTVNKTSATVSVTSSLNPSGVGQAVTFTARLSSTAATGSIEFLDGIAALATVTVSAGVAAFSTPSLAIGAHSITVAYSGDGSFVASNSTALAQVVNKGGTTAALTSSLNPSAFGTSVTFTTKVTPTTATGPVQFLDGASLLGSGTLSGGSASLAVASLAIGAHSVTGAYGGDANNAACNSPALTQTVTQAASGVTLTTSNNQSIFGQTVTFTAKVTPTSASGSVQFLDGATVLGTGAVSGGTATLATSSLSVGQHSITAVYSGDGNDAGSTSAVLSQFIVKAGSSVTLTSSVNPSAFGQAVTFTAKVASTSGMGTVQFLDGAIVLGTGALSGGAATLPVSSLAVDAHSITAVYSGDANNGGSTSAVLTQTVNKGASIVAVASSADPSSVGQAVTFKATVTPGSATGGVQFMDFTAPLGTGTVSGGAATLPVSTLTAGAHSIIAVYSGDGNNAGSTSPALTQTVNKGASSVALSSSANPSTVGQSVTFTAKVTPATATGSVQFLDGTKVLGTGQISAGVATFTATPTVGFAIGTHSMTAVYSGDGNNLGSTSPVLTQTVNKTPSSIVLTSSANPSSVSQAVTFTVRVTPTTATGNVVFVDNITPLGSPALNGGVAVVTVSPSTSAAGGLTAGVHVITATYLGDANTAAALPALLTQTVNPGGVIQ
jgi:hypothetical protein